jgi:SNF2 family DNA or RNA helicase
VEKSLLPKTETILFTGMSVVQKNLYRQILLRDIDTINNNTATANSNDGRTANMAVSEATPNRTGLSNFSFCTTSFI